MSRWLFPFERRILWEQRRRVAIGVVAVYLVLRLLDRPIFRALYVGAGATSNAQARREQLESHDWAAMLRLLGFLPLWLALAAALWMAGRGRDGLRIAGAAS